MTSRSAKVNHTSTAQPWDVPLPGLGLPSTIGGVDSAHVERLAHQSRVALYWKGVRQLRKDLKEYHDRSQPPYEHREIIVRIVVGEDRVGAVVDWRDGRMGRAGLLHRVAGPLRVRGRTVRGVGPTVALQVTLQALLEVLSD